MAARDTPLRISRNVSVQQVGAETLVYDSQRHLAFCLNASSAAVWHLADGKRSLAEISVAASTGPDVAMSEELVCYAVETLRVNGLIEPMTAGETTHAEPRISRRTMLQRLGVGGAMLLPAVASIVAPTAAQAYNGCVDCSTSNARAARTRKLQQGQGSNQ